jgi:hypothetical protein
VNYTLGSVFLLTMIKSLLTYSVTSQVADQR